MPAAHLLPIKITMKVYNLSCQHDHCFEGWFSSEQDFVDQSERKLIGCPICDSSDVRRMPSAPRLNLSGSVAPAESNAALQALWLEAARQVVANTEDVGVQFAEEARRIHYDRAPMRAIRGVASSEERDALVDEGIDVVQFSLPPALKQPLQ
jgi:hypothetical protein